MAVLTDILIAPEHDVPAIVAQWPGAKNWPALQTTGLDWLILAELAEALDQAPLAQAMEQLDPASSADEVNGPWVYVLPMPLRDTIAALGPDRLGPVAKAWAGREEADAAGLTPADAERLLRDIHALAIRARDEGKPMLLWISL